MDNGYAKRDYLTVKRARYTNIRSDYGKTVNKHEVVSKKEASPRVKKEVESPVTLSKYAGVTEKYRIMSRTGDVRTESGTTALSGKASGKTKEFVYVEHSGIKGTFRDAFCTKRVKSSEKSCFDKVVLVLLFAVLMFFVAGSYCEYYDAFRTTKNLRSEIAESREQQAKLLVAIEERNDRIDIDDYAVNVLGLVKSDKLTKHYVAVSEKDTVSITVNEDEDAQTGGILLSGFKNVISNFTSGN